MCLAHNAHWQLKKMTVHICTIMHPQHVADLTCPAATVGHGGALNAALLVQPLEHLVHCLRVPGADVQLHLVHLIGLTVDLVPPLKAGGVEVLLHLGVAMGTRISGRACVGMARATSPLPPCTWGNPHTLHGNPPPRARRRRSPPSVIDACNCAGVADCIFGAAAQGHHSRARSYLFWGSAATRSAPRPARAAPPPTARGTETDSTAADSAAT